MKQTSLKEILQGQIEMFREKLYMTSMEYGVNSPETLCISQRLNELILKYQKLVS
jgi:hypothetical protein